MPAQTVPASYHSVTPYLALKGASEAIDFYMRAFGATESFRLLTPDGQVAHAEIRIGDSCIMLAEACGEAPIASPVALSRSSVGLHVYVEDVDARFAQAVAAGAKVVRPVQDQFYGDRTGTLQDPFGHVWFLATHTEDVAPDELARRAEALFKQRAT